MSFFLDFDGYFFLKTFTNSFFHQFDAWYDHIHSLATLLDDDKHQVQQQDLSSARAKTGQAANLHDYFVRTGLKCTHLILLHDQITALLKKNTRCQDGKEVNVSPTMTVEKYMTFIRAWSSQEAITVRLPPCTHSTCGIQGSSN
jgi:hypothetical protein